MPTFQDLKSLFSGSSSYGHRPLQVYSLSALRILAPEHRKRRHFYEYFQAGIRRAHQKASPNSKSYITIPSAFLVGGLICVIGQLLFALYRRMGMIPMDASTLVSITLVAASAVLTGLNV